MTSIIIAGKPNSEEMSQCILLAENIHNLYPSTRFTIVLKHENEWETYSKDLCNLFALQTQTHPLILFSNGKQIGDTQQFFKLISDSFKNEMIFFDEKTESYTLRFDPLSIANLTQENTTLINKEYTRRTKDLFITDKILNALDRIEISKYGNEYGKYNTITTDYDVEYLKDLKVFVKYHEKYTPNEDEYKEEEDLIVFGKVVVSREEYMKFKEELERKKKELEQMNNPIQQVDEGNDNEQGDTSEHKDEQQDNANVNGDKDEDKHDKKKKGTVNKGKDENNTATNNDVVAVMQSQSIEGVKEGEDVPERKELKFGYYRDLDIPIKTYEEDILVQKYHEEGFELILNPAFTFLGETLINKPLDDTPVKLEKPVEEKENKQQQQQAQQEGEDEVKEGNNGEVKDDANEEDKNNEEANNNNNDDDNAGANKEHETNEQQVNANDVQDQQQQQQQQSQLVQSQIQGEPSVHDDQQQQQPNEPEEEKIEYPHDPNLPTNSDPNSKNAEHPDKILIKDYGKMPSLRKMVYEDEEYPLYEDAIPLYQLEHNIHNRTNLHNIESFVLNEKDLTTMIQMIQETEGYATLRILPYKYADWKEFGSSKIKIIPKKPTDLKGDVFPIELKIEQQLKKIRRDILIQKQMQLQQEEERKSTKNEGEDVNEQSQIRFTSSDVVKGEDNDEEEAEGEGEANTNNNNVDTVNNNNDDNKSKASVSSKSSAKSNPKSSAKSITSRSKQSVKSAKSDKSFKSEKSVAKSEKSVKSAVAKSEKSAIAKSTKSVAKSNTASKIEKSFMTNPQYTDNFAMPSLFTLDVYDSENIKHCIKHFPLGQFNLANVKEGIQSMLETLEINNSNGNGLILVCSDTFLFMAPLTEPFTYTKKQLVPMFAEPHFFMGVFTLPVIESEWPDSIKRKTVVFDFADILRKSTN